MLCFILNVNTNREYQDLGLKYHLILCAKSIVLLLLIDLGLLHVAFIILFLLLLVMGGDKVNFKSQDFH